MNWEKCFVFVGQLAVLAVLGTLVALGKNSGIHDGLMAVCGSIAGVGLFQAVRKSTPKDPG